MLGMPPAGFNQIQPAPAGGVPMGVPGTQVRGAIPAGQAAPRTAPQVNKRFDDDEANDLSLEDANANAKLIPGKNEFKKMNQVQPGNENVNISTNQGSLIRGSINRPDSDIHK